MPKWWSWRAVTAFLWSWAVALMTLATAAEWAMLAEWSLLVGMLGVVSAGGVLIEVERRRTEDIADLIIARSSARSGLSQVHAEDGQ